MTEPGGRYAAPGRMRPAEGWTVDRLTPPSRLFGANGLRTGPDGRVYVALVSGSQISAIDLTTGAIEAVSPKGSDIVAPDDLAFDEAGNLYATEITEGRVSMRAPDGRARVLQGGMTAANPITVFQGRLIAGECRPGGRIFELDRDGGPPRVILADVPLANAFEVGPDGMLYFPVMGTNEIWRVSLDGGRPEVVAGDLGVPVAVKFDTEGRIVTPQVASGQVLRLDSRSGAREVLASIAPGLDNITFAGGRLIVSSISGQVNEVLAGGGLKSIVPDGLNWPLGLAMMADGTLFVADGPYAYWVSTAGERRVAGMLFTPGIPGYIRGAAASGTGEVVVTTSLGHVARWRPQAQESQFLSAGFDRLYGVALAADGGAVIAEAGTGRVHALSNGVTNILAENLAEPIGVALDEAGAVYASEHQGERVVRIAGGRSETIIDGLQAPQGIAIEGDLLFVVDAGAQTLLAVELVSGRRTIVADNLPIGAPPGVTPKFLGPIGDMSGPMGPFADVTVGRDGSIYVSGDAEGSVLRIRRQ